MRSRMIAYYCLFLFWFLIWLVILLLIILRLVFRSFVLYLINLFRFSCLIRILVVLVFLCLLMLYALFWSFLLIIEYYVFRDPSIFRLSLFDSFHVYFTCLAVLCHLVCSFVLYSCFLLDSFLVLGLCCCIVMFVSCFVSFRLVFSCL